MRQHLGMVMLWMSIGAALLAAVPGGAQSTSFSGFATNTPQPSAFATNTPHPMIAAEPVIATPETSKDRYALRLWQEDDLLELIASQIGQLDANDIEGQLAVRLMQYELQRRFPGAPHRQSVRDHLLEVMLAAPRGSVDMRYVVRPWLEAVLNEVQPPLQEVSTVDHQGFRFELTPADVDGAGRMDALIHTRYPADSAEPLYEDYVLVQIDTAGSYRLLEARPPYPAAPLREIQSLALQRFGDFNGDGLDDLALTLSDGQVNQQLMVFGWRNDSVASIVEPGLELRYAELADWPLQGNSLQVVEYHIESPPWGCIGERYVAWSWSFNFFRPTPDERGFRDQESLACTLYRAEPLFRLPLSDAIATIEDALNNAGRDELGADRAQMALAALYLFDGQADRALEIVTALQAIAQPGSWLAQQTDAFMELANRPNATLIQVCAALQNASDYGACDVDQALERIFEEQPLLRDEPIPEQLAQLGISVEETTTISQVGRRDRTAVRFSLAGVHWWAFAPLSPDTYTAERMDAPMGRRALDRGEPLQVLVAPRTAYDALLVNDDASATLNLLENVQRDNPGIPLSPAAHYLQAMSFDLLGNRAAARDTYYGLWAADPEMVWGQLAAAHLERR